jgi:DHA1 family bicyclomycin/chloramphenicol resistance-like MFS transporter
MEATLGGFMLAFALGQLVYGPLSDRWGRRPPILLGLLIYVVGGVLCTFTPNAAVLVCARILQGLGACAGAAVTRAIVRDLVSDLRAAASLQSYITVCVAVAPIVAPLIGAAILPLGWRAIYGFLVIAGVVLFGIAFAALPETLRSPSSGNVLSVYKRFIRVPGALPLSLLIAATFGGYFSFISGSPFVLQHQLGLSSTLFALCFAINALSSIAGSFTSARLAYVVLPQQLLYFGTIAAALAGIATFVAGTHTSPVLFVALMAAFAFSYGLAVPQAYAIGLHRTPEIAGTASAALGAGQQFGGSVGTTVVGMLPFAPSASVGMCAAVGGIIAAAASLWFTQSERGSAARRFPLALAPARKESLGDSPASQ